MRGGQGLRAREGVSWHGRVSRDPWVWALPAAGKRLHWAVDAARRDRRRVRTATRRAIAGSDRSNACTAGDSMARSVCLAIALLAANVTAAFTQAPVNAPFQNPGL